MPKLRDKLLRLQTIIRMMKQDLYPNYQSFLVEINRYKKNEDGEDFFVSEKTFQRDIADLKRDYKARVSYSHLRRGYHLEDKEWFCDVLLIGPQDVRSAIIGEKMAEKLAPDPLQNEIKQAVSRLLSGARLEQSSYHDSLNIFSQDAYRIDPAIFKTVHDAWEKRQTLEIDYVAVNKSVSKKLFDPHLLAWQGGSWYLKGAVLENDGVACVPPASRVFAIHRIAAARVLERYFQEKDVFRATGKSIFENFAAYPEIQIRYRTTYNERIREKFYGKANISSEWADHGKTLILTVKDIPEYEALEMFFFASEGATVLAPPEFRNRVIDICKLAIANNQEDFAQKPVPQG